MIVALIFGGKSSEHSVSVATAITAYDALKDKYEVLPVYIDKYGVWHMGKKNTKPTIKELLKGKKVKVSFSSPYFYVGMQKIKIDCAFLCLHGVNGEDGSVQGVLRLASIPFTGCDVTASAVGMDKVIMKDIFKSNSISCVDYFYVRSDDYLKQILQVKEKANAMGYPLIIKPANAGSSIGISIAKNGKELDKGLKKAFTYDNKVIVERALQNIKELNCAVLKSENRYFVSCIEKPTKKGEILSYVDKYSLSSSKREIPAQIDSETEQKVKALALATFRTLSCAGVARIDFLVDMQGNVFVNEINTIPGSLSFYLFASSFTKEKVCSLLIDDAIYNKKKRDELSYTYQNEIFASKF